MGGQSLMIIVLVTLSTGAQVLVSSQVLPGGKTSNKPVSRVNSAFDDQFYEDFLDDQLCEEQLTFLSNNSLRFRFLDSSGRIPTGILTGNLNDLGDYHHCLAINHEEEDMSIHGKYCAMVVPFDQELPTFPDFSNITWPELPRNITLPELPGNITLPENPGVNLSRFQGLVVDRRTADSAKVLARLQKMGREYASVARSNSRVFPSFTNAGAGMTIAICIPKVCSSQKALKLLQQNIPTNISANEYFCRLPDDKPFVAGDYVAIVIFSLLGFLNVISTTYDLVTKFYYKRDVSESSKLFCSFSVYTNTRRLLNFSSSPGSLECIDGIRAISMMWVIAGHTFAFTLLAYVHNAIDIVEFLQSLGATWLNAAPITVDTFFMLTGLLVVYTTIGKVGRARFFRGLHLFYLNRFLRLFPLLASVVLFQATLSHHIADGPFWINVAHSVQNCRDWWWSALLHVQNYVNPLQMCLIHTWYLSVDTQLYIISPLVLWFLWGHRRSSWTVLIIFLLLSLVASSVISFLYNFSAAVGNVNRIQEFNKYSRLYYFNTLTRAPPFFVGMIYGYMLHIYRDRKIKISRVNALILWMLSLAMMAFCVVSIYPVMQPDHTAQTFDNFLNAYVRAIWAAALGWVIFACVMGYGGPVNWFLCLRVWKLPARLSFAMYLIHIPVILLVNGTWVKTHYFFVGESMYRFVSDLIIALAVAFFISVTIDAPFSTLQKLMFGGGMKRPEKPRAESTTTIVDNDYIIKTSL